MKPYNKFLTLKCKKCGHIYVYPNKKYNRCKNCKEIIERKDK